MGVACGSRVKPQSPAQGGDRCMYWELPGNSSGGLVQSDPLEILILSMDRFKVAAVSTHKCLTSGISSVKPVGHALLQHM